MAICDVSIVPIGTRNTSLSSYVARAVEVLENEDGISYELTGMGTTIEGELNHILSLIGRMHEAVLATGVRRVVTTVKIDDRRDKAASPDSKVKSVRRELGYPD